MFSQPVTLDIIVITIAIILAITAVCIVLVKLKK